jgi:hypothetical protein
MPSQMGAETVAALATARLYDRIGLSALAVLPVPAAAVSFLAFTTNPALIRIGALAWGRGYGDARIHHEGRRRRARPRPPPRHRVRPVRHQLRARLARGSTASGALPATSPTTVVVFVLVLQAAAPAAFLPLVGRRPLHPRNSPPPSHRTGS